MLPNPGAMVAAPLTGQGPHRSEEAKQAEMDAQRRKHGPPKAPPAPPKAPPRQPQVRQPEATAPSLPPSAAAGPQQPAVAAFPGLPASVTVPAVASLVAQVLNAQRQVGQKFLLLVLPEDDWPRCEEFDTVDGLVSRIKALLGEPCHLFPFMGTQLTITQGPNRFLRTPLGAVPLFDIPDPDTSDPTEYGWVGPSLAQPGPPPPEDDDEDAPVSADDTDTPGSEQADPEEVAQSEDETPMFGDA